MLVKRGYGRGGLGEGGGLRWAAECGCMGGALVWMEKAGV